MKRVLPGGWNRKGYYPAGSLKLAKNKNDKLLSIYYLIFREWMKHEKGGARKDNFLAVRLKSLVRIAFLLSSMERNPPRIVPYMDTHFLENGYALSSRAGYQCT